MNPYDAYTRGAPSQTRIDTLLGLYDVAIDALDRALNSLRADDSVAASRHLARSRLAVTGLAAGVDMSYGIVPQNFLRLYEYVLHVLGNSTVKNLTAAQEVLQTLRDGLQEIRSEAIELERSGSISPIGQIHRLLATA